MTNGETNRSRQPDVLLVDDSAAVRRGFRRVLARFCDVREVSGVADALLAIELRVPDLLLTDFDMPDGGGARLLVAVAQKHPRVSRIVVSGNQSVALARLLGEGLAHAVVAKGGDLRELVATVTRLLGIEP